MVILQRKYMVGQLKSIFDCCKQSLNPLLALSTHSSTTFLSVCSFPWQIVCKLLDYFMHFEFLIKLVQFIYMSIYLSIYLFFCLSVCLSICLFFFKLTSQFISLDNYINSAAYLLSHWNFVLTFLQLFEITKCGYFLT